MRSSTHPPQGSPSPGAHLTLRFGARGLAAHCHPAGPWQLCEGSSLQHSWGGHLALPGKLPGVGTPAAEGPLPLETIPVSWHGLSCRVLVMNWNLHPGVLMGSLPHPHCDSFSSGLRQAMPPVPADIAHTQLPHP